MLQILVERLNSIITGDNAYHLKCQALRVLLVLVTVSLIHSLQYKKVWFICSIFIFTYQSLIYVSKSKYVFIKFTNDQWRKKWQSWFSYIFYRLWVIWDFVVLLLDVTFRPQTMSAKIRFWSISWVTPSLRQLFR